MRGWGDGLFVWVHYVWTSRMWVRGGDVCGDCYNRGPRWEGLRRMHGRDCVCEEDSGSGLKGGSSLPPLYAPPPCLNGLFAGLCRWRVMLIESP